MEIKIFNKKQFLLPESHRSMATYHAKVMEDGIMKLTMHDCKGSIQLHNNLNNPEEISEAIDKLTILSNGIFELLCFIRKNYDNKPEENFILRKTLLRRRKVRIMKTQHSV